MSRRHQSSWSLTKAMLVAILGGLFMLFVVWKGCEHAERQLPELYEVPPTNDPGAGGYGWSKEY